MVRIHNLHKSGEPPVAGEPQTESQTHPLAECHPQAACLSYAALMQIVYTARVIPKVLLRLWSNTADKLQTIIIIIEGQDMGAARVEIEEAWTRFILTSLLHVDSHPTLSRFFLSGQLLIGC